MGKIRVEELAAQMGIGSKEVLFLLQSIGVDVKSPQAALDESTVLAILQGKTHAPKQLIVRDTESKAFRPQKSALSRIKIVEKTAPVRPEPEAEPAVRRPAPSPAPAAAAEPRPKPAEPARTAVVPSEPDAEPPPKPALPRKIVLPPPRPAPGRPLGGSAPGAMARAGAGAGSPAMRPTAPSRPMGPASGSPSGRPAPSVYRPTPGGPGMRPAGAPLRPTGPAGRPGPTGRPGIGPGRGAAAAPPVAERAGTKRKKEDEKDTKKPAAKRGAKPKITVADEVDLREFVGAYEEDTYSDITLPLIEKAEGAEEVETVAEAKPVSKSALRRAAKSTRAHDSGKLLEFKKPMPTGPIFLSEGVTVKELSEKLGVLAKDIQRLLMQRGILATVNQTLDASTAIQIAKEVGVEAAVVSFEEELELARTGSESTEVTPVTTAARTPRAPVVTVMGHVDHGKTSLLDAIRQTKVAEGEAGGITQHIGAYRVEVHGRPIVFLDTPGHEAFTSMRARGARATDIVVLVVAADDGVMPQTVEAIDHARAAKVPIVVAINKIDKANANPDRVRKELADHGVLLESWGGEVPSAEISALKKQGIDQLLELLLIVADLQELTAPVTEEARGVVLEARREAGRGNVVTVLVQSGTLRVGDVFFAGAVFGRVRSMADDRGNRLTEAGPATPVEVTGFEDLPQAGDTFQVVDDEAKARSVASFRQLKEREKVMAASQKLSLDQLFNKIQEGRIKELPLIVKADVAGSAEVLSQALKNLSNEKVKVSLLHVGVGAININDVLLASASGAIIVGFNVRPEKKAEAEADKSGVELRLHTIIYNVTDEIRKAMEGLLEPTLKEVARGRAEVRNTFKVPKFGVAAGCYVTEGSIGRSSQVRLLRDNRVIYEGKVASLRRFKDDVSEVKQGFECGIALDRYQDVKVGDVIEAYQVDKIAGVMEA
ncbi:MAG TPA: translation initiation factor IF-2 [Thermoanaerobaculia bacterium]|jgi:translation initiation factor IF-2